MNEQLLNFTSINSKGDIAYFDHIENAIDSLETACFLLTRVGNTKWKWISISMHHSLYSFCISYLHKGNKDNVIEKSGKGYLIKFRKALDKTLETPYHIYANGPPKEQIIRLTKVEKEKIYWLNSEVRNSFIHFIPKVDEFSINEIKAVCLIVLNLIELLAIKSNSITYLDFEDSHRRIKPAIETLRNYV